MIKIWESPDKVYKRYLKWKSMPRLYNFYKVSNWAMLSFFHNHNLKRNKWSEIEFISKRKQARKRFLEVFKTAEILFKQGMTLENIARRLHTCSNRLGAEFKRRGYRTWKGYHVLTLKQIRAVSLMYKTMSTIENARKLGVSSPTIYRWLKVNKIKTRHNGTGKLSQDEIDSIFVLNKKLSINEIAKKLKVSCATINYHINKRMVKLLSCAQTSCQVRMPIM